VLPNRQAERLKRFRPRELIIAPFFCEESSQEGVVRLAD